MRLALRNAGSPYLRFIRALCLTLPGLCLILSPRASVAQTVSWVSAYYAGWQSSYLPPDSIDFTAITQLIHFSVYPTGGASFDGTGNGMTASHMSATVQAAHRAGKKIILCVGGYGADFKDAVSPAYRSQSIANLVAYMTTYGYDGLDIDWEPVQDEPNFLIWIAQLRSAMQAVNAGALLTDAAFSFDQAVVDARDSFDQINLMTYDMAGPWPGWVTWHNSPVSDGGFRFPSTGGPPPSANGSVDEYLAAGVPASKLGIGTDFLGYYWTGGDGTPTGGVTAPRQSYTVTPSVRSNVQYYEIMDTYEAYPQLWDSSAQASYISIDKPGSANDMFISLDNERTEYAKADYVRSKGIGGIIIFELGAGYRANQPPGQKDFLLQAVKKAFMLGQHYVPDVTKPVVAMTAPAQGSTVGGTVTLSANASDNSGVVFVQFLIEGVVYRSPLKSPPFTIALNTWKLTNGSHRFTARASDRSGNVDSSSVVVTVNNVGTPPVVTPMVVYDESIRTPFINSSWSCSTDPTNTAIVRSGLRSIRVNYADWGALDFNSGQWNALVPIDPMVYDTLQFDVYPLTTFDLDISFYNGTTAVRTIQANTWNHVIVPLTFLDPFTRFDLQRNLSGSTAAYFDNIQFTGFGGAPPPPPPAPDSVRPSVSIAAPATGATVAGQITLKATATDNVGVVGVHFRVDTLLVGGEIEQPPYTYALNTWYVSNGTHVISAVAHDGHGNADSAAIRVTVSNQGPPPNFDLVVYSDSLLAPFQNDSWGATVDFGSTDQVLTGKHSARVDFTGWGAFDLLCGTWGALVPVNTAVYDTLSFLVYPTTGFDVEVSFYAGPVLTYTLAAGTWNTVNVPLAGFDPFTRFYFRRDIGGTATAYFDDIRFVAIPPRSVTGGTPPPRPTIYALNQNYPNPFNPATTIGYSLAAAGHVRLSVYDLLGREIARLVDEDEGAGSHTVVFDAGASPRLASGVYFYRMESGTFTDVRKLVVLR